MTIRQDITNDIFPPSSVYSTGYELLDEDINRDIHKYNKVGSILCITDPPDASIYLDGVLQPQTTSALLENIKVGLHTISLVKAGYRSYTEKVRVRRYRISKICVILLKIANIVDKGIVICQTSDISSCPISPMKCPTLVTPLDYTNLITIIDSTSPIDTTVRFIYSINGDINTTDVLTNLMTGTNVIYAFPANTQYPANTVISLEDVVMV